jgi:hypothetical protein
VDPVFSLLDYICFLKLGQVSGPEAYRLGFRFSKLVGLYGLRFLVLDSGDLLRVFVHDRILDRYSGYICIEKLPEEDRAIDHLLPSVLFFMKPSNP